MSDDDSRKREIEATGRPAPIDREEVEEEDLAEAGGMLDGLNRIGKLFTVEDWLNVLTRSPSSVEESKKDKNK